MKHCSIRFIDVLAILLMLNFSNAVILGQSEDEPSADVLRNGTLRGSLEEIRESHDLPALAGACVVDCRLHAIAATGRRRYDRESHVTIDDQFHIGSCTKSMTATLAAILVNDGGINWDTTVAEVFPDLADDIKPEYRTVTLEHLLTHRSGLPEDRAPDPMLWMKIRSLDGPMIEQRRNVTKLVLTNVVPLAEPGERFAYSNMGYVIAGAMLEAKTGRSWEDLMRDRLFNPLGINSAGFGPPGGEDQTTNAPGAPNQPWGHRSLDKSYAPVKPGPFADNPAVLGPAGTVHVSLSDWAKYAAFHLETGPTAGRGRNGNILVKEAVLRKLHAAPDGFDYAFGWGTGTRPWARGRVISHSGSNTMWFAVIWIAPERGAAFIAATNSMNEGATRACDDTVALMITTYLENGDDNAALPDDEVQRTTKETTIVNSEVKTQPEYHVAYLRHVGPYDGIGEKFGHLFEWAGPRGFEGGAAIGVYWDDPATVDAARLRSDACVAVPQGTEVEGDIKLQTIPGGEYLVCRTHVYNNDFKSAWDQVLGGQVPVSGREITMDRPCYELYHNNAMEDPENKWIIDICIPVK